QRSAQVREQSRGGQSDDLSGTRGRQDALCDQAPALARAAPANTHVGRTQVRTIVVMVEARAVPASWSGDADEFVRVEEVVKIFGDTVAVRSVNLSVRRHEIFALLGSSGCGKTTLLRRLAGVEDVTSGRIYLDNEDITSLPPYMRPVNMMFQSYALFPHMSVEANVAFGLK